MFCRLYIQVHLLNVYSRIKRTVAYISFLSFHKFHNRHTHVNKNENLHCIQCSLNIAMHRYENLLKGSLTRGSSLPPLTFSRYILLYVEREREREEKGRKGMRRASVLSEKSSGSPSSISSCGIIRCIDNPLGHRRRSKRVAQESTFSGARLLDISCPGFWT